MNPRLSIITLGVSNLNKSYDFYKNGLGLPTTRKPEEGIIFFQTTGATLALYPYEELAKDIGPDWNLPKSKFSGITIAHNTREKDEVDFIMKKAENAGGKIVKEAHATEWGGYSGYFTDLDGYLWEIAYGAFDFNDDGSLNIT